MKHFCQVLFLASVVLPLSSGCGTMLNMNGAERLDLSPCLVGQTREYDRPTYPFGGLGNDVVFIKKAEYPVQVIAALLDMPFSLVGDVVTFPWTLGQRPAKDRADPLREYFTPEIENSGKVVPVGKLP